MNVKILVRDSVYRAEPLCTHYVSLWTKDGAFHTIGLSSKRLKKQKCP